MLLTHTTHLSAQEVSIMELKSKSDKGFLCIAFSLIFTATAALLTANLLFLPMALYGLWLTFLTVEFHDVRVRLLFSLRFAFVLAVATLVMIIL